MGEGGKKGEGEGEGEGEVGGGGEGGGGGGKRGWRRWHRKPTYKSRP